MLAWLPLVAALALAAGSAGAALLLLAFGLGGRLVSPVAEVATTPLTSRVRHVLEARAPDSSRHSC